MKEGSYTVRLLERVSEIPSTDWDGLIGEHSSPFVEHAWLDALEETGCVGGDTGWLPMHITLWRGERLVAAAPSYVKTNSEGEFVFDWGWADAAHRAGIRYYPKLVVAVPFTPATGDRVLVAPGEDRARAVDTCAKAARECSGEMRASSVHVLFPREDEARVWEANGYLRRDGFQFHWFRTGARSFDEYLARFSSKQRNQIRREIRGVESAGIVVRTLAEVEHTTEIARTLFGFYSSTIAKHGVWGRMYLNVRFFERVVERFRDRLACVLATDAQTGAAVAAAFNVLRGPRLYGRYWGARVDVPFLHFVVCYYAGIRFAIERGLDVFEPGAGGEHKRVRGFVATPTHSAHWIADPRLRSALASWLERERTRVAEIILAK